MDDIFGKWDGDISISLNDCVPPGESWDQDETPQDHEELVKHVFGTKYDHLIRYYGQGEV